MSGLITSYISCMFTGQRSRSPTYRGPPCHVSFHHRSLDSMPHWGPALRDEPRVHYCKRHHLHLSKCAIIKLVQQSAGHSGSNRDYGNDVNWRLRFPRDSSDSDELWEMDVSIWANAVILMLHQSSLWQVQPGEGGGPTRGSVQGSSLIKKGTLPPSGHIY